MPSLVSKIPIGFNLDGYNFLLKQNTAPTSFGVGASGNGTFEGVDAAWAGGLVDGRWVADESLKQVQVQLSVFQSAPLQYTDSDGKKYYGEVFDSVDDWSKTGDCAFMGNGNGLIGARLDPNDINDCKSGQLSTKLASWDSNIARSESGRKEFYCGVAFAPATLVDYLNHFYNLSITWKQASNLAKRKVLCVEILFNLTGTSGKAFRIKVVDSLSDNNSAAGSFKTKKGNKEFEYDGIDIMTALLLTSTFSGICTFKSKPLNQIVNEGTLMFPWVSAGYNYKKAKIPGYSPSALGQLGLSYESKAGTQVPGDHVLFKTHELTPSGRHAAARVRFFVDSENKSDALGVIPNLPDEFFRTNYADGAVTSIASYIDPSQYSSLGAALVDASEKIMKWAVGKGLLYAKQEGTWHAVNLKMASGGGILKYYPEKYIDCDGFVNWALLEAGLTQRVDIHQRKANQWTAGIVTQSLFPQYKAIEIGNITQAEAGDILIYGKGASHAAVFAKIEGGSIKGYGMGTQTKANGSINLPVNEMGTSMLSRIIRIVKA